MQMIYRLMLSLLIALQFSLASAVPSHAYVRGEISHEGWDAAEATLAYDLLVVGFELNAVRAMAKRGELFTTHQTTFATNNGVPPNIKKLSEANITNSGETVLGHFPGYINKANSKGASYYDIGDTWEALTPDQRWAANTNFLDKIVSKGDTVNLSIPKGQVKSDSYLEREIDYLINQKGYKWVNQWSLKPPSGN